MKAGLIGFSHGETFLAKGIQLFQKIWLTLWDKKDKNSPIWNHVFMTIEMFNKIYVLEANQKVVFEKGKWKYKPQVKITQWECSDYAKSKVKFAFKEPVVSWTPEELFMMTKIGRLFEGRPYDKINIPEQIVKSLTNVWIGKMGTAAEMEFICCEVVATILHHIRPELFKNCASINVMEVWVDPCLKDFVENV
jgi:hypothetical protein